MLSYKQLADTIYPDLPHTPEEYEAMYPERKLPEGAKVTRLGPSPTGFIHLGNLYGAFVDERLVPDATSGKNVNRYNVIFTPQIGHGNYVLHGSVPVFVDDWGNYKQDGDNVYWEDDAGMTSALVTEDTTWLKEQLNGKYWWFGLSNPKKEDGTQVFEIGSRFWVMCLNKNSKDWDIYYSKLDNEYKNDIEEDRINLFVIGVTSPDGTVYTDFEVEVPLYVQLDQNWDQDLQYIYVDNKTDEIINDVSIVSSREIFGCPIKGDSVSFTKVMLKHFSTHAIYDKKDTVANNDTLDKDLPNNTPIDINGNKINDFNKQIDPDYNNENNYIPIPSSPNNLLNDIDTGNILPLKSLITLISVLGNKLYRKR